MGQTLTFVNASAFGKTAFIGALALVTAAGCTASGTAERGALGGAAAGAAVGAIAGQVIGGRPGAGAAAGAALGALGGAAVGCNQARDCFGRAQQGGDRRYDNYVGRYYYVDPRSGDTYWENGEFRSYGRGRGRR
ncbi:MAG: hypothetical protein AAF668_14705 [Pseudomonadota bacterium]